MEVVEAVLRGRGSGSVQRLRLVNRAVNLLVLTLMATLVLLKGHNSECYFTGYGYGHLFCPLMVPPIITFVEYFIFPFLLVQVRSVPPGSSPAPFLLSSFRFPPPLSVGAELVFPPVSSF